MSAPRASKRDLLMPVARPPREVEVPGLGLTVAVRDLTAAEQAACVAGLVTAGGMTNLAEFQARQLGGMIVDPVLTMREARDIIATWTPAMVNAVLNGADDDEG